MKVHFYTKGDERTADSRQRGFRIAEELKQRGIDAVVHAPPVMFISTTPWPKKGVLIVQFVRSLFSIRKGDVVFLQRAISNKYFFVIMVAYLKIFRRKMIFDFDDAIYMHDFFKTKTFTKMASAVFVCSKPLEAWAKQYNPNVHIFHTTVKFSDYSTHTKNYESDPERVVVGWIGTAKDHYKNLALLSRVFQKLIPKISTPFIFVLIGERGYQKVRELFDRVPGLAVEYVDYINPAETPRMIQGFDIGVNPLMERGEWNLARSSFKPYEYMACGVAQITSAVGEITRVVVDGVNGLLADSEEEWAEKLTRLIEDRQLRKKLGQGGQQTIREQESYEAILPRMVQIIETL